MRTAVSDTWHSLLRDPSGRRTAIRKIGLGKTMVIDKGMGLRAFSDFAESAGRYTDIVKLAFGTAVLYDTELLRQKLRLAETCGMLTMPGGTLLEAAVQQGEVVSFMDSVCELGFTAVEVSDGTIAMSRLRRTSLIKEAASRGLYVVTEYGKKAAGSVIDAEELAFTAECDLEAGAELITVEARESGINVGVFDEHGRCRENLLQDVVGKVGDSRKLMWEAPRKEQQAELLNLFGAGVHLGNIAPADAIALEAMRRGLRSDTFHFGYHGGSPDYMI